MQVPQPSNPLKEMFFLQSQLLVEYRKIENLPEAPVDLNDKPGQRLVKDFVRRAIEELAESYTTLNSLLEAANNNTPHTFESLLLDYNEEISDALHFILELLIFSGINDDGIDLYFTKSSEKDGTENMYKKGQPLKGLLILARFSNSQYGVNFEKFKSEPNHFRLLSEYSALTQKTYLMGGRLISNTLINMHEQFLWEITYLLNRAVNNLKNKDWTQTEKASNILNYQEGIMQAFFHVIRYFEFLGYNEWGIYVMYYSKNLINQRRIKDGY